MVATLTPFASALQTGPVILDGGLGTLLEARGNDVSSALWSARVLHDDPDEVRAAHAEFFDAGAQVAVTASYQVGYDALAAVGVDQGGTDELLTRSVTVARQARDENPGGGWVAASIGPYGATLGDGSEYRGVTGMSVDDLRRWHRRRLRVLADAGPDLIAVETITSLVEIEAIVRELDGLGVPAWVSLTVDAGTLRSGESLAEAFALAGSADEVVAVGVNCCSAHEVSGALAAARAVTALPLLAYPNSGEQWDGASRTWSGDDDLSDEQFLVWSDAAAALGGCCRITPQTIARIAQTLREHA
ncbi:MAG: homocysteine S-methyltransferase [Pseudolysinimonas sp.]